MELLPPPLTGSGQALFLDFDGTLVEIASHPDSVRVDDGLVELLMSVHAHFRGALAIVSGRSIDTLDAFLGPNQFALAGLHGLERRLPNGDRFAPEIDHAAFERALTPLREYLVAKAPGAFIEDKGATVAAHFRKAPELEGPIRALLEAAAEALPGYHVMQGKMVLEIKPNEASKGAAVEAFLREAPFKGAVPVFVGDDVTDEEGFAACQASGGFGIKVGSGPSCALHRVPDVSAVWEWLRGASCQH